MVPDLVRRLRAVLPEGSPLPEQAWRLRHRVILWILALHAPTLGCYALVRGYGLGHSLVEVVPLVVLTWLASQGWLSRRVRAALATFGLLTASAVLVHLSGGLIESHFHFFVMLFVITFYQDWATFLLAIAYVVVDHGVVGVIAPHATYNHPAAWNNPVKWAGVHALFVAGASVAAVANWRLTERAQAAERAMADQLAYQASHDALTGLLNRREFERSATSPSSPSSVPSSPSTGSLPRSSASSSPRRWRSPTSPWRSSSSTSCGPWAAGSRSTTSAAVCRRSPT